MTHTEASQNTFLWDSEITVRKGRFRSSKSKGCHFFNNVFWWCYPILFFTSMDPVLGSFQQLWNGLDSLRIVLDCQHFVYIFHCTLIVDDGSVLANQAVKQLHWKPNESPMVSLSESHNLLVLDIVSRSFSDVKPTISHKSLILSLRNNSFLVHGLLFPLFSIRNYSLWCVSPSPVTVASLKVQGDSKFVSQIIQCSTVHLCTAHAWPHLNSDPWEHVRDGNIPMRVWIERPLHHQYHQYGSCIMACWIWPVSKLLDVENVLTGCVIHTVQ